MNDTKQLSTVDSSKTNPAFGRDSAQKAQMLDIMSAERFGAHRLLQKAHELFPINQAKMPADFKGTHSITLNGQGELVLHIWWDGLSWPLKFEGGFPESIQRAYLPPGFPPVEAIIGQPGKLATDKP